MYCQKTKITAMWEQGGMLAISFFVLYLLSFSFNLCHVYFTHTYINLWRMSEVNVMQTRCKKQAGKITNIALKWLSSKPFEEPRKKKRKENRGHLILGWTVLITWMWIEVHVWEVVVQCAEQDPTFEPLNLCGASQQIISWIWPSKI